MKRNHATSFLCISCISLLLLLPPLTLLLMAFKDYSPVRGLFGSSFVGFDNIFSFLSYQGLPRILWNTLLIQLFAILSGTAYLYTAFRSVCSVNGHKKRLLLTVLFTLPALIPANAYTITLTNRLPIQVLTTGSVLLQFIAGVVCGLRYSALFVVGTLFSTGNSRKNAGQACLLFLSIRLLRILTLDTGFLQGFGNPLTYEYLDVYNNFLYRKGLMEAAFSLYAGGYVVQCLLQLLPAAIGVLLLYRCFLAGASSEITAGHTSAGPYREPFTLSHASGFSPILLSVLLPLLLLLLCLTGIENGTWGLQIPMVLKGYWNGLLQAAISTLLIGGLGLLLALAYSKLPKPGLFTGALLYLLLDFCLGPYLLTRTLGLINTLPGVIFQALPSVIPIGLLGAFLFHRSGSKQETRSMALACFGILFAWFWGNHMPALLALNDLHTYPISLMMQQSISAKNAAASALIYQPESGPISLWLYVLIPVLTGGTFITLGGLKSKAH